MKLSLHMGAKGAAFSPGHNDGSMYTEDRGYLRNTRPDNIHFDMYRGRLTGADKVGATGAAIKRFYEERLRDEYGKTLESASWKRNPDRVVDFETWCAQKDRSVREVILSVGDKDEYPNKACLAKVANATIQAFEKSGLTVIASDMHIDEATPHVHIILGADLYGKKLDFGKTLADHGIERPEPGKKKSTENNEMKTLTEQVRKVAEDTADEWLKAHNMPLLDRKRVQRKKHETNAEFKARRAREDADEKRAEQLAKELEKVRAEKEQAEAERDRARRAQKAYEGETYRAKDGSVHLGAKGAQKAAKAALEEKRAAEEQRDRAREEAQKLIAEAKAQADAKAREIYAQKHALDERKKKLDEREEAIAPREREAIAKLEDAKARASKVQKQIDALKVDIETFEKDKDAPIEIVFGQDRYSLKELVKNVIECISGWFDVQYDKYELEAKKATHPYDKEDAEVKQNACGIASCLLDDARDEGFEGELTDDLIKIGKNSSVKLAYKARHKAFREEIRAMDATARQIQEEAEYVPEPVMREPEPKTNEWTYSY